MTPKGQVGKRLRSFGSKIDFILTFDLDVFFELFFIESKNQFARTVVLYRNHYL